MSYSFTIKAETKQLAKQAVASEFDKMAFSQPIHARDRAAALANANAVIDLLADDDTKDIAVSCNGSVSWDGDQSEAAIHFASITASASYTSTIGR